MIWHTSDVTAVEDPFEIQVFDGQVEVMQPYRLISGKRYRLQAVSLDKEVLTAQWFLAGNLGRITTGNQPTLTTVFVGEGDLICRVNGVEQRVRLSVVPATGTIGNRGGTLKSPAGVEITLPESALAIERQIGDRNRGITRVTANSPAVSPCRSDLTSAACLETIDAAYISLWRW